MLFYSKLNINKLKLLRLKSNSTGKSNGRTTVQHRSTGAEYYISSTIDYERKALNLLGLTIYNIKRYLKPSLFLLLYASGFLGLILAPEKLLLYKFVLSSFSALPCQLGNAMPLKYLPVGSKIHNIDYAVRSAGVFGQILRHKKDKTLCKLPSGKSAWFFGLTLATFGALQNAKRKYVKFVKAGDSFLKGRRPVVRGTAMNPIDHPHGGGQGKTSGGRPSVTPFGKGTKGYKTVRAKQK